MNPYRKFEEVQGLCEQSKLAAMEQELASFDKPSQKKYRRFEREMGSAWARLNATMAPDWLAEEERVASLAKKRH